MARKSTKEARYDRMGQFEKRKYKRKNSPNGKEKLWTDVLLERLKGANANGN